MKIVGSYGAFAAMRTDGSVVTWGNELFGGGLGRAGGRGGGAPWGTGIECREGGEGGGGKRKPGCLLCFFLWGLVDKDKGKFSIWRQACIAFVCFLA